MSRAILELIYEKPDEAPWTIKEPPAELTNFIKSNSIKCGKVLDLGCGEGYYSAYLASLGFNVTGIDISRRAINYSIKNSKNYAEKCKLIRMDATKIHNLKDKFDIILEWGLLHFIPHNKRNRYFQMLYNLLEKDGIYFSVSFNEQSPEWGGGRVRKSPRGNKVYYSSTKELAENIKSYFHIKEIKTIKIGKLGRRKHIANLILSTKLNQINDKNDK